MGGYALTVCAQNVHVKKSMTKPKKQKKNKPKLEALFAAIRRYQQKNRRAEIDMVAWAQAEKELRDDFKELGIEDAFDWNED